MADGITIVRKGGVSVGELAVENWIEAAGGLEHVAGALKVAGVATKFVPFVDLVFEGMADVVLEERLKNIEKQLELIRAAILTIFGRLAVIDAQFGLVDNVMKRAFLDPIENDLLPIVQKAQLPASTPVDFAEHCITLSVLANRFLESGISIQTGGPVSFHLWRSTAFDTSTVPPTPVPNVFALWPTLCTYATIIRTWAALRRAALKGGATLHPSDGEARARHVAQLTARPEFQRNRLRKDDLTLTLAETAMDRVSDFFSTEWRAGQCHLIGTASDDMHGHVYSEDIDSEPSPAADCDLNRFGVDDTFPAIRFIADDFAGISVLDELRLLLMDDAPVFAQTPDFFPTKIYVCLENGDLRMQQTEVNNSVARVEKTFNVGTGWDRFRKVIANGGLSVYGLEADGNLIWYWHEGYSSGAFRWVGPISQRKFDGYRELFGSSDGVFYAVDADGLIYWYRHDGFETGDVNAWRGPVELNRAADWGDVVSVFGLGDGRLYAFRADGSLTWHLHPGFLDGSKDLSEGKQVGKNWGHYKTLFADPLGQIFARDANGQLNAFRHRKWLEGSGVYDAMPIRRIDGANTPHRGDLVAAVLPSGIRGEATWSPRAPWTNGGPVIGGGGSGPYAFALAPRKPPLIP